MYPNSFFIPNIYANSLPIQSNLGYAMAKGLGANRGLHLFSKLGNSLQAFRSINWQGLINNTSKTLGIINQTIPIVKQVGPMMNNMRSMLRIASIFKDETDVHPKRRNRYHNTNHNSSVKQELNQSITESNIKNKNEKNSYMGNDYSPTFFITSS